MPKKPKSRPKPNSDSKLVTDFGTRAISNQNFSKMIALPKTALANCSQEEIARVNVQLVQDKEDKYIKLTPLSKEEKGEEKS